MTSIFLALLAGILTIAAPCTLPVLPALLGASVGQTGKARPAFIAVGFVTSFAIAAVVFSAITQIFGIDQNTLRTAAAGLLLMFGALMLWPRPLEWASAQLGGLLSRNHTLPPGFGRGNAGGFILGTTLGLVWTPCAGPVLGSILTVIASSQYLGWGAVLLCVYAVGAAIPMLTIAWGGQAVTARVRSVARFSHRLQQSFSVLVIAFAVATYLDYDTLITAWLSRFYPTGLIGL